MPEKSIRTIGATVILAGVAVAAVLQMGPGGDPSAIALITEEQVTSTAGAVLETDQPAETTTTSLPFTYRLGVLAGVSTDNFWAFYGEQPSVWNSYILGPTKPALFKVDPSSSELVPELAESHVQPNDESGAWSVKLGLRDDMAWSDGEAITADDVVFTFETVRTLDLGGSWAASFPESILAMTAISGKELRIEFADRPTFAVWPNALGTAPIMPQHIWADVVDGATVEGLYAQSGTSDVGGGPLAVSNVSESLITSVANPGYGLESTPDIVEYRVFEDEATAVEALVDGGIDAILTPKGLSPDSRSGTGTSEAITMETNPANGVRYLGFNLERQPMSDHAFRTALALMLDREGLAQDLGDGSPVAHSFIGESNGVWYDDERASEIETLYSGDLASRLGQAVEGLRSAGYAWGTDPAVAEDGTVSAGAGLTIDGRSPAPLTILTPGDSYDPARPDYVDQIARTLGLLGFEVRAVVTDFDTVVDLTFSHPEGGARQYDMYLLGWTLGSLSFPDYHRPLFAAGGAMNNTGYANPEFEEQLDRYEGAASLEDAREHLWAMELTLARDLPYLVLYTTGITEAYRSDRVEFGVNGNIGGIQARLGGIGDVKPVD